ncbi:dynein light chain Tctex-type protein 2B-like [Emydura macquarii macquarii]|uniref:dynein light chain Tctex-type protein 2B-like n=1 Tax=Emydura macquarii macquarii TaxID=1129001 RepID=UPI00352AE610
MNARTQKEPKASKERETGAKKVTFNAAGREERAASKSKPAPAAPAAGGYSPSKLQMGKETTRASEDKTSTLASVSLRGLLAAQRLAKEFKNQAALKNNARLQSSHHKPITIINEKIPVSSAKPKEKFSCARTEELLREYLPTKLSHVTYEPAKCASLTTALSDEIKHLVKQVTPPRYKLVVNVTIGNKGKDETVDIMVTSQCLWDPHSDNFMSSQYVNETLFCVVLVHAVYFE